VVIGHRLMLIGHWTSIIGHLPWGVSAMSTAKDVIRDTLANSDFILKAYLADLSDGDLLVPPVEGMNPVAWQLGHLISVERDWIEKLQPGSCPALPGGFGAAHGKETAAPNPFRPFCGKAEYVQAWDAQRAATLSALDALPDAKLSAETGIEFAPTNTALLNMIGIHALMHVGQFVPVRRKAGLGIAI
jgi:hypothetical protein